jgi:UDP-2,3-diacylglucosamine pyrophosphatase LpxH
MTLPAKDFSGKEHSGCGDSEPGDCPEPVAERVIVVSDLHFGRECSQRTVEDFSDFIATLKRVKDGTGKFDLTCRDPGSVPVIVNSPTKFILLGDIVDLWDPRNQDRNNALRDFAEPLSCLSDLDCDVVYVAGNHDEDITEFIDATGALYDLPLNSRNAGTTDNKTSKEAPRYEKRKFKELYWTPSHSLMICARHYPEDGPETTSENQYLKIGGLRYYFVHGQQYDREQIGYTFSQILNRRFDPVDYFQDLANISFSKSIPPLLILILGIVWVVSILTLFGFFGTFLGTYLRAVLGGLFVVASIAIPLTYYNRSGIILEKRNKKDWRKYFFSEIPFVAVPFILVVYAFAERLLTGKWFELAFVLGTYALTYFALVSGIPKIIASGMRGFYNFALKSRDLNLEEMVQNDHFRPDEDRIESDVIVFGHTHLADCLFVLESSHIKGCWERGQKEKYTGKDVTNPKLLVNTGSWEYDDTRYTNTFAYIDDKGISLMSYRKGGKITCLCHLTEGEIRSELSKIHAKPSTT